MPEPSPTRGMQAEIDISHLFHGHEIVAGTTLSISTTNEKPGRAATYRIGEINPNKHPNLFAQLADEGLTGPRLALWISGKPDFSLPPIPLSKLGSIRMEILQQFMNVRAPKVDAGTAQFITTDFRLSIGQLLQLWNSIVLTPDEDRAVAALKILEKSVERIAQVQVGPMMYPGMMGYSMPGRGGFFVRLLGSEKRIPIGSFGDGMWRMLALAVALARAKDNILLVDEIDTGLHYTVMADMWKLVNDAAALFNVQVFATTHSYDCVHSLATICSSPGNEDSAITIQRIEPSKKKAVAFTGAQIRMVAERDIEVR